MRKLTKKENALFISECEKLLIKLGAEKISGHPRNFNFTVKTRIGKLYLKIDDDNAVCYSVFGNFFGIEQKAKEVFGHWKYNYHGTGELPTVLQEIENHLKNILNTNNEFDELFFEPFTAQRRELRKIWNENHGQPSDSPIRMSWETFLADSDKKAVKVADALKISLLELSRTYGIKEILNLYNDLYQDGKNNDRKNS